LKGKFISIILTGLIAAGIFADTSFKIGIEGTVEWDTLRINAEVSLDLASADIKLPAGRSRGESLISSEYIRLILPGILNLQVDSSSTIADLVRRGELSLFEVETIAMQARSVPPALSPDLRSMSSSYTLSISGISAALLRHERPSPVLRTLNPTAAPAYTGIIIIASDSLPVYGMLSKAMPIPCLFPKIWDTSMNLIYERNMLDVKNPSMVLYSPLQSIFRNNPSGLSPELITRVGECPLRIFARGVFGINPTDLIIDDDDALAIISSNENRRLLSEGKVAIILDDSILRQQFSR
jgi:hypothetical protein